MKKLNWNEEYVISFELDGKRFSTPSGRGFATRFDAEDEVNRLKSCGAKKVKVFISKWS